MPETRQVQGVQIQCPNCGTPYQVPLLSIIDVGQHPELRQAFLAGAINLAVCPKCRQGGVIDVPLLYHDPAAEFLALYFPPHANITEMERHKIAGEMTQALLRNIPTEQRKGYLFNPRQFMNRQGLMDAILGTMGISQEELDRQRKKLDLLDKLAVMADDPKGLAMMIKGQDELLDYEFFLLLSHVLEQRAAIGDEASVNKLVSLREKLMEMTAWGKKAARQQAAIESLGEVKTADEFLEKMISAEPDVIDAMAVAARPMLDYSFFQRLTERIEASSGAERERLTQTRERLLKITQQMDAAARAALQEAAGLLKKILSADNPRQAVREHLQQIDETFLAVLEANIQQAERTGATIVLEQLQTVADELDAIMEEAQPPEVRLINALLSAPYPEGCRALLKERQNEITPEFLEFMGQLADTLAERGDDETAKRVRDIQAQAMLLV